MAHLRTLFIVLLLVNLVLFAWSAGYFGAPDEGREPQRLSKQLAPEKIRVLGSEGSGALAQACRLVDGLSPDEAQRLRKEAEDKAVKLAFESKPVEEATNYWVLIPAQPDRAAADKKLRELLRLGLSGFQVVEEEGPFKFAIVLGAFKSDKAAAAYLEGLGKRGVRSAKVQARDRIVVRVQLTLRGPADSLEKSLRGLLQPYAAATLALCPEAGS